MRTYFCAKIAGARNDAAVCKLKSGSSIQSRMIRFKSQTATPCTVIFLCRL
ncbi:hypothetical protein HMPREF9554_01535 [Treponema phagedenis F0421]|nr:hypothetical protein HMPREF9554_01535 [Treponema phagedenis F0421]